jgi:hypothetical protein
LKLIQKNTGRTRFELGVEAVVDPDNYLSDLVVRSYRGDDGKAEEVSEKAEEAEEASEESTT